MLLRKLGNLLYQATKGCYYFLAEKKFVRGLELLNNGELTYGEIKEHWNDESRKVHGDTSSNAMMMYYKRINEECNFNGSDNVVDIGCGEGTIDSYIRVNKLYGMDISDTKIAEARAKNPDYVYGVQSFLDDWSVVPDDVSIDKVFSFGVVQYCKPEDIEKLLKKSIDVLLKECKGLSQNSGDLTGGKRNLKLAAHIEIPDIEKAYVYYQMHYGINEKIYQKHKEEIRIIFSDGSYWHNVIGMKEICEKYIEERNVRGKVYVSDSRCFYRSNLVVFFY